MDHMKSIKYLSVKIRSIRVIRVPILFRVYSSLSILKKSKSAGIRLPVPRLKE